MFVSGPDRHERDRAVGAEDALGEEVDRVLLDRAAPRRRGARAVEARLAVDVGGDEELAGERAVGAGRDRDVAAPTNSSTRSAFAVVFSSVWLPATVVTPSRSSSGWRARAGVRSRRRGPGRSRAGSASGLTPPAHERVEYRRFPHLRPHGSERSERLRASIASTSRRAKAAPAPSAPAAQRGLLALATLEQRDDEARGEGVAGRRAVHRLDRRRHRARATSTPSSRRSAPSAPSVSAKRRPSGSTRAPRARASWRRSGRPARGSAPAPAAPARRSGRRRPPSRPRPPRSRRRGPRAGR